MLRIQLGDLGPPRGPTRISEPGGDYIPRHVCPLLISRGAFWFSAAGILYACDGGNKLYKFADPASPRAELVREYEGEFCDFALVTLEAAGRVSGP